MLSNGGLLYGCKVKNKGNGNTIILSEGSVLKNCIISFCGNNNTIIIGKNASIVNSVFCFENDQNRILIGDDSKVCGRNEFACIEGTEIIIGSNCLFSGNIYFRTGDSHSVLDLNENRINPSCSIVIGDHVWICQGAIITKGVHIADNSIIGIGAVVTRSFSETNIAIGGNPAKCIKQNINWNEERFL